MGKKLISLILTAVMMISLIPVVAVAEEYSVETLLYSENFESYTVGTKPQMDVYESTSSIAVATVGSTKALHIKNINGILSIKFLLNKIPFLFFISNVKF